MSDPAPRSTLEPTVELVKALTWPVFAAALLISFWSPLQETAIQIPKIVGRSDSITIAGLSLKVGTGLKSKASPEVEKVLERLSAAGIERLLALTTSGLAVGNAAGTERALNAEVTSLGLVAEFPLEVLKEASLREHKDFAYGFQLTELGIRTQSFLRAVASEFAQQLSVQSSQRMK